MRHHNQPATLPLLPPSSSPASWSAARKAVWASCAPGATPVLDGYAWARAVPRPTGPAGPAAEPTSCFQPAPTDDGLTPSAVGVALLTAAKGHGCRHIAEKVHVPAATVRGWLQRARANSDTIRANATIVGYALDPVAIKVSPTGSPLGDVLEAFGLAVAAYTRRLGPHYPPWQVALAITSAGILAPRTRPPLLPIYMISGSALPRPNTPPATRPTSTKSRPPSSSCLSANPPRRICGHTEVLNHCEELLSFV